MDWVTLEINLPRDVQKSPLAMEIFLTSLLQGHVKDKYPKYWKGDLTPWFSLEIASIEGSIYFFIRTIKTYKDLVESHIYAQYPKAEINEVDDYTRYVPDYNPDSDWDLWGCEFILTKEDAYPIRTYVDYGLDKSVGSLEEEEKTDPLSSVLEFMGSMQKNEQLWFQIMVKVPDTNWKEPGEEEIKKIMKRDDKSKKEREASDKIKFPDPLTPGEESTVKAIERSLGKQAFDCGMRGIYIFKKDSFRLSNIFGLLSMLKPFSSPDLNGFKPQNGTGFVKPWHDFKKIRERFIRKQMFDAYIQRSYFYKPFGGRKRKIFVLTTEELATIYRFPGRVTETPSLERIESVKSEPPINLPS